jgi:diaminobutyrate acetyltransferase
VEHDLKIRSARENEFLEIHKFVSLCKPLESYAEHFYKIVLRYFGDTCYVAEQDGQITGFILGFFSQQDPETYFLWQIGVHPEKQGEGIGKQLLQYAEKQLQKKSIHRIELTIDPENTASKKLFEQNGYQNSSFNAGSVISVNGMIAIKDYYSPGRHFMLYDKHLNSVINNDLSISEGRRLIEH